MRRVLWYVGSTGISEQEKKILINWEWQRAMLVSQVLHKLARDVYENSAIPFPVPFQIEIKEETMSDLTRIKATVFVEEEDVP